jgi:hypothetical protein
MISFKRQNFLFVFFTLVTGSMIIASCVEHNLPTQCSTEKAVSFSSSIKPIITSNCAIQGIDDGCHNGDNGADLDWRVFGNFQNHADEVKRRIMLPKSDSDHMPREGELDETEIKLIVCWVEQGALNN